MQAVFLLLDLEENAALDTIGAPCRPLLQDFTHTHHPGHARNEDVEITGEAVLQGGHAVQLLHQLFRIHTAFEINGQLQAAQIGLIAHVGDLFDLTVFDQIRHLVHDHFRGGGIGDLGDLDQIGVLDIVPLCPELEAAAAGGIDLPGCGFVIQQFCAGGEIRAGQGLQDVMIRVLHQCDGGLADLLEVKRANIGCHTHGDALVGRYQHIGECGGQQGRFLHGSVVVIHHVHRVGVDILKDLAADAIQLGFGITGGRIGHIPGVDLTEVTLGIHKGMQQRFIAPCQTHHGLINGRVTVGIEPHGLTDNIGRLGTGSRQQTHLVHGVQQLPVRGLKAVDLRNRAGNDHRHGIGHVVDLQSLGDGLLRGRTHQTHYPIGVDFFLFLFRFFFLSCHTWLLTLHS